MEQIYFCGSIRGGREKALTYSKIIELLEAYGKVLTEHVGDISLAENKTGHSDSEIFNRDIAWLDSADLVIAEVSVPSLGVGYEIAHAVNSGKPVLCLFDPALGKSLSAMINGCPKTEVREYSTVKDIEHAIREFMSQEN